MIEEDWRVWEFPFVGLEWNEGSKFRENNFRRIEDVATGQATGVPRESSLKTIVCSLVLHFSNFFSQ